MFSLIYLVALLSLFESQVYGFYDYEYHYEEFCNKHYSIDSPQYAFCEYYHAYIAYQSHEFPSMKECGTCKAFIKLLELNGHTERAVENLMNYTSKHFCKKVPTTQRSKCTTTMATYRPQMRKFISSVLSNGTFCEVLLKCRQHNETQVQPESYKFPYMSEYVHHYDEYYQYFYHAQNYPSEFSPYYFFFHFFYDEEHYHPFYFFEGFADEHEVEHHLIPYHDFELFSHNLTDFHSFYPWNIFDYFFKNYYEDNGFNFFYFYHYYMKKESGNIVCDLCRDMATNKDAWLDEKSRNEWKQKGYSTICANEDDQSKCHEIVDITVDYWSLVLNDPENRKVMCTEVLQCASKEIPVIPSPAFPYLEEHPSVTPYVYNFQDSQKCGLCQVVMMHFDSVCSNDDPQLEYLDRTIQTTCGLIAMSQLECLQMLNANKQQIKELYLKNRPLLEICQKINQCQPNVNSIRSFKYFF